MCNFYISHTLGGWLHRPSSYPHDGHDVPSNILFSTYLGNWIRSWNHLVQSGFILFYFFLHTSTLTWECTALYVEGSSPKSRRSMKEPTLQILFFWFFFNRICISIAKNIWQSSGCFVGNCDASSLAGKTVLKYHCWVSFPCFSK